MSVLISIQHPAHVHFFKNIIRELEKIGVDIHVVARDKDIALKLLEKYNIEHTVLAGNYNNLRQLVTVQAKYELGILRAVQKNKPEIMMAIGEPGIAHVSSVSSAKSYIFTDTENATLSNSITFPFSDYVYTPECYQGRIQGNHITYPGYHELAYLHPNRFDPDPSVFDDLEINREDRIAIIRLVSWDAAHDVGDKGLAEPVEAISKLEKKGVEVLVSSETGLPSGLDHCHIDIPLEKIHDLMYYSDIFLGESATMATECAILGVPSIFVSSSHRGYTDELESEYGLVFNYSGPDRQKKGMKKALSILDDYNPSVWERRHKQLLNNKIDTTEFVLREVTEELDGATFVPS